MKAIFPGSFDPITNGHLDLIKRASLMFDEVIVALLTNSSKQGFFTLEEKIILTKKAVADIKNVSVISAKDELTVEVAKRLHADVMIRGVRSVKDFEYEQEIALINKQLAPEIETVLLLANPQYSVVSSSMIKEIAKFGGTIENFVCSEVQQALLRKWAEKD
ncbi:pantetheine-phosphate adenylyltransferase [Ligilactobacillus sp. Marseille-Q7487]|uniref:pantetheine-phosphate adenylyltransferase n=1 Tax=Ligilactobacillus sp. Marseille-Q7487 TaxID=3022128 RepID=UPI0024A9E1CB|nr:pantetheine-phosphate adenylyltransferase [Ligilactobacillus sp. Marseille-Q7487]